MIDISKAKCCPFFEELKTLKNYVMDDKGIKAEFELVSSECERIEHEDMEYKIINNILDKLASNNLQNSKDGKYMCAKEDQELYKYVHSLMEVYGK